MIKLNVHKEINGRKRIFRAVFKEVNANFHKSVNICIQCFISIT